MNAIIIMDEDGIPRRFSQQAIVTALAQCSGLMLFGMDFLTIRALRAAYLHRGGGFPITQSSVEEIFKK